MDGGYNAANVKALMEFKPMPFSGSPPIPFALSALFGWMSFSSHGGIKIVVTLSLLAVGFLIYLFVFKVTGKRLPSIAALLGWVVSLAVFTYPTGYLKQTVALPFLVAGVMSLYFLIVEKKKWFWAPFALSFPLVYFSHEPSFYALVLASFVVGACLLADSDLRTERIFGWAMVGLTLVGVVTSRWTVPLLAHYIIQLDPKGYKTILIYLKGLLSYRYEMTVDFGSFDYLLAAVPVFGLAWTVKEWRKLGLWLLGFGIGIFILSIFGAKYEWQGRNIMTMFVPLAILVGLGFYHIAGLLEKASKMRAVIGLLLAVTVVLLAAYPETAAKYVHTARPIISTEQLQELGELIMSLPKGAQDNIYARHGLRFWATYETGIHCGAFFYDWDKKALGVRKSRGEDDITSSRGPGKEDFIILAKFPMYGTSQNKVATPLFKVYTPDEVSEYMSIKVRTLEKVGLITVKVFNEAWKSVYDDTRKNIAPGTDLLFESALVGLPKGKYFVQVEGDGLVIAPQLFEIKENLLYYSNGEPQTVAVSKNYVVVAYK